MRFPIKRCLVLFAALFFLGACSAPVRNYPLNPANPIYTVAVLPLYNASNDVDGARLVREEFFKRLQGRHYLLKPLKEVDQILMDQMGITLGSQLEMTNAMQLGETLGVDGLIFGYLLNFDDIMTGVYNAKKVRAGFKFVDVRSGNVAWSRGQGVKSELAGGALGAGISIAKDLSEAREGLDAYSGIKGLEDIPGIKSWHVIRLGGVKKPEDAAALALAEKLITKTFGIYLKNETEKMLNIIMAGFPSGPGAPVVRILEDKKMEGQ